MSSKHEAKLYNVLYFGAIQTADIKWYF